MFSTKMFILFLNDDATAAGKEDFIEFPYGIKVNCQIPGWLQRMEFKFVARSKDNAKFLMESLLGRRAVLLDAGMTPIVDGWVMGVNVDEAEVHCEVSGAWKRMTDLYHQTDPTSSVQDWGSYLQSVLTAVGSGFLNANYDTWEAPSQAIGANYTVGTTFGKTAREIVTDLLPMSDTSFNYYDMYVHSGQMSIDMILEYPYAALKYRKPTLQSGADVIVSPQDLTDESYSGNIHDLRNANEIWYGATPSAGTEQQDTDSQTKYWKREYKKTAPLYASAQAANWAARDLWRSQMTTERKFVIGSKWLRSGHGATTGKFPAHRLLIKPTYLAFEDTESRNAYNFLGDRVGIFPSSNDVKGIFGTLSGLITSIDYDYDSGQTRVVLNGFDYRLDAQLEEAGVIKSQAVWTPTNKPVITARRGPVFVAQSGGTLKPSANIRRR